VSRGDFNVLWRHWNLPLNDIFQYKFLRFVPVSTGTKRINLCRITQQDAFLEDIFQCASPHVVSTRSCSITLLLWSTSLDLLELYYTPDWSLMWSYSFLASMLSWLESSRFYFPWEYLKTNFYFTAVDTREELWRRIQQECLGTWEVLRVLILIFSIH
jgi:hypothetical protein